MAEASRANTDRHREGAATVPVRLADLRSGDSPRLGGLDNEHIRMLADLDEPFPPILVRQADMCVVDGMHRVAAAKLRGDHDIEVRFFRGSTEEAFLVAVQSNVSHGLPLSTADRQAAAERLIRANPDHSDRLLARTTGLAAKTIAAIRRRVLDGVLQPTRVGHDGRVRPLSTAEGRLLASQVIAERPDASLREIARAAGISVGTARDVRARLSAGQDPVPPKQRNGSARTTAAVGSGWRPRELMEEADLNSLLDGLRCDPSLRYSDSGKEFLRWLGSRIPRGAGKNDLGRHLPPHSGIVVAKIARECARVWLELADEMDRLSRLAA